MFTQQPDPQAMLPLWQLPFPAPDTAPVPSLDSPNNPQGRALEHLAQGHTTSAGGLLCATAWAGHTVIASFAALALCSILHKMDNEP